MTIELKEDIAYILLKKMGDRSEAERGQPLDLEATDFVGRNTDKTEILAHLDYLNQKGYINADFKGDAYADEGPNPLPGVVRIKSIELTPSGQDLLKKMSENPPEELRSGPSTQVATKDMDFLNKVMLKGHISDIYDARDITEVVFRTMRDLMTTEANATWLKGCTQRRRTLKKKQRRKRSPIFGKTLSVSALPQRRACRSTLTTKLFSLELSKKVVCPAYWP